MLSRVLRRDPTAPGGRRFVHQFDDERGIVGGIALPVEQVAGFLCALECLEVRDGTGKALVVGVPGLGEQLAVDEVFGEEEDVAHRLAVAVAGQLAQEDAVAGGGLVDGPALSDCARGGIHGGYEGVGSHGVVRRKQLWGRRRRGAAVGAVGERAVGQDRRACAAGTRSGGHGVVRGDAFGAGVAGNKGRWESGQRDATGSREQLWRAEGGGMGMRRRQRAGRCCARVNQGDVRR